MRVAAAFKETRQKNLTRPYILLGNTEIYLSLLKECFDIELDQDGNECGICEECVVRLRDASDFKLLVQRSQETLRTKQKRVLQMIKNEPVVKTEIDEDADGTSVNWLDIEFSAMPDLEDDSGTNRDSTLIVPKVKKELDDSSFGVVTDEQACTPGTRDKGNSLKISLTKRAQNDAKQKSNSNKIRSKVFGPKHKIKKSKRFTCDVCNREFAHNCNLKRHKRLHTGEKPHACKICNKKFTNAAGLFNHQFEHTGVKPFTCDICSKQYTQLYKLKNHQRIHSGEKPFSCKLCRREFGQKADLTIHTRRIHIKEKNHACGLCQKQFLRKCELSLHMTKHTGQQPFSCKLCDKKFLYNTELRRHILVHTGEKPFTCDMCNAQFKVKLGVMRHIINKVCRKSIKIKAHNRED